MIPQGQQCLTGYHARQQVMRPFLLVSRFETRYGDASVVLRALLADSADAAVDELERVWLPSMSRFWQFWAEFLLLFVGDTSASSIMDFVCSEDGYYLALALGVTPATDPGRRCADLRGLMRFSVHFSHEVNSVPSIASFATHFTELNI